MTIRTALLKTHLYVGLTIAVVLLLVAASGAALVFEENIDRALHPGLSYVTPGGATLKVQALIAKVALAYPDVRITGVSFPEAPGVSLSFSARSQSLGPLAVYVNQYTGDVLGYRTAEERERGLARRIHLLHTRLFGGQIGEWLVGTVTALTLLMAVTGLCLWWPRKIVAITRGRSWRRTNFDLHNVFGLYASTVFLFIALTGMMIAFEGVTDPLFRKLDSAPLPEIPKRSAAGKGAAPMDVDQLIDNARAALPGAFLKNISAPAGGSGVAAAGMKFPEDRTPGGRSRVFLDQYSGRVLAVLNTRTAPLGTRLINLKRSAHTGDIFGAPTQALYFLTSLMLVGQIVTGFFIWWKPRPIAVDVAPRARHRA
jgi:uncharacterized iron-regulated membrane protein